MASLISDSLYNRCNSTSWIDSNRWSIYLSRQDEMLLCFKSYSAFNSSDVHFFPFNWLIALIITHIANKWLYRNDSCPRLWSCLLRLTTLFHSLTLFLNNIHRLTLVTSIPCEPCYRRKRSLILLQTTQVAKLPTLHIRLTVLSIWMHEQMSDQNLLPFLPFHFEQVNQTNTHSRLKPTLVVCME